MQLFGAVYIKLFWVVRRPLRVAITRTTQSDDATTRNHQHKKYKNTQNTQSSVGYTPPSNLRGGRQLSQTLHRTTVPCAHNPQTWASRTAKSSVGTLDFTIFCRDSRSTLDGIVALWHSPLIRTTRITCKYLKSLTRLQTRNLNYSTMRLRHSWQLSIPRVWH